MERLHQETEKKNRKLSQKEKDFAKEDKSGYQHQLERNRYLNEHFKRMNMGRTAFDQAGKIRNPVAADEKVEKVQKPEGNTQPRRGTMDQSDEKAQKVQKPEQKITRRRDTSDQTDEKAQKVQKPERKIAPRRDTSDQTDETAQKVQKPERKITPTRDTSDQTDEKAQKVQKPERKIAPRRDTSDQTCSRDADGYYWITGRTDDLMNVSGHLLSTAQIESALMEHSSLAEAAVVGFPHSIKGTGIYCFVTLKNGLKFSDALISELKGKVRERIGPIATPDVIQNAPGLPKTRSGKIMCPILRKIASNDKSIGDTTPLADPSVVEYLFENRPS